MSIGLALHILGAIMWVGGMFFAYVVLRPSAGPLEPAIRLKLWAEVLSRFFRWVWLSIALLLASGFAMAFVGLGGFASLATFVRTMMAIGLLMVLIYFYLFFVPWRRFRRAVLDADWPAAAQTIERIRVIVGVNLILGLVTAVVGAGGRYFG